MRIMDKPLVITIDHCSKVIDCFSTMPYEKFGEIIHEIIKIILMQNGNIL